MAITTTTWYVAGFALLYWLVLRQIPKLFGKSGLAPKGLKYTFTEDKLLLDIPLNPMQTKTAEIKLSEINECRKVNRVEALSIQESFDAQLASIKKMTDLIAFGKGKIARPRYYERLTNYSSTVYFSGKDLGYLVTVEDADNFVSTFNQSKKK